jgi:hypothetical protein
MVTLAKMPRHSFLRLRRCLLNPNSRKDSRANQQSMYLLIYCTQQQYADHVSARHPILRKQTKTYRVSNSCSFRLLVAHLPSRECAVVFSITLAHNGRGQTARFATPSEADDATSNNATDCLIARRRLTRCKVFHAPLGSSSSNHCVRDYRIDMRTSNCLDQVEFLCRNLTVPKDGRTHTLDAVRLHDSCRSCGARPTL